MADSNPVPPDSVAMFSWASGGAGWAYRRCSASTLGADPGNGSGCSLRSREPTARVGEETQPGLSVRGLDAVPTEPLPWRPEGVRPALPE